jgi:hypothetical protein
VPSWIAGPKPGSARTSSTLSLEDAAPEVRNLVERMDALADRLGLRIRATAGGWAYHPAASGHASDPPTGLAIYPRRQSAELNLQILRDLGADELAEDLHQRLQRITGVSPAAKYPMVSCAALMRNWEETRTELIEPYFEARATLARQS